MKTTSKNIFFLDADGHFESVSGKKTPSYEIEKLKDFSLLVSDKYFIHETIRPKIPSSSKSSLLVKNYLTGIYPEEMIKNFFSVNYSDSTLILLGKKSFDEVFLKYKEIFKKALKISTPAVEALKKQQKSSFYCGNYWLKTDGTILYELNKGQKAESFPEIPEEILCSLMGKNDFNFTDYRKIFPTFILLTVPLLLFGIGKHFEMRTPFQKLKNIEYRIDEIYKLAGVEKDSDPYGKILYMANKMKLPDKIMLMPIMEKVSTSFDKNDLVESLQLRDNSLNIEGKTKDFKTLDTIKNNLVKNFSDKVEIINTKIQKNYITFSLKVQL